MLKYFLENCLLTTVLINFSLYFIFTGTRNVLFRHIIIPAKPHPVDRTLVMGPKEISKIMNNTAYVFKVGIPSILLSFLYKILVYPNLSPIYFFEIS
jgi:hypothetical protein